MNLSKERLRVIIGLWMIDHQMNHVDLGETLDDLMNDLREFDEMKGVGTIYSKELGFWNKMKKTAKKMLT